MNEDLVILTRPYLLPNHSPRFLGRYTWVDLTLSRITEVLAAIFQELSGRLVNESQADTCGSPFSGEVVADGAAQGSLERVVQSLVLVLLECT